MMSLGPVWEYSTVIRRGRFITYATVYFSIRPSYDEILEGFKEEKFRKGMEDGEIDVIRGTFREKPGQTAKIRDVVVTDDAAIAEKFKSEGQNVWYYKNAKSPDFETINGR